MPLRINACTCPPSPQSHPLTIAPRAAASSINALTPIPPAPIKCKRLPLRSTTSRTSPRSCAKRWLGETGEPHGPTSTVGCSVESAESNAFQAELASIPFIIFRALVKLLPPIWSFQLLPSHSPPTPAGGQSFPPSLAAQPAR